MKTTNREPFQFSKVTAADAKSMQDIQQSRDKKLFISNYINECKNLISNPMEDHELCQQFFYKCFRVLGTECETLKNYFRDTLNGEYFLKEDLQVLLEILEKHRIDVQKPVERKYANTIIQNTNSNNVAIEINISNTLQQINEIKGLSDEEKVALNTMLFEIEMLKNGKDKKTLWDKIKATALWVLDKGVDVMVATMPYLTGMAR